MKKKKKKISCLFSKTQRRRESRHFQSINVLFLALFGPSLKAGLLRFGSLDIWVWTLFCCGGCSVPCEAFSSIPGLDPLDARDVLPCSQL